MHSLFEKQDSLNTPIECFIFDASKEIFPVRPHWHYFAEFIFMLRGTVRVTADDCTYSVSEGECMILHPSSVHSIFASGDEMPVYAVLKFDMGKFPSNSSYAPSPAEIFRFARRSGMASLFDASQSRTLKCREIFTECISEMQNYLYGADVMLRAKIYQLIFGIVRVWIAAGLNIHACPTNEGSYGIENITEYIDRHLDGKLKVSEIARECHLSYSNFAAKFHMQYGMPCKDYIERMRIFKAEEYLMFTDHDLSYISQHTGFSDQSHFIRVFKKHRNITPKQFRQQRGVRSELQ